MLISLCVYNSLVVARSDLQAQHAWNDRWLGKTRPDSSATGNNTGHRLGPCVLLHLERGWLDREGKTFARLGYPRPLLLYAGMWQLCSINQSNITSSIILIAVSIVQISKNKRRDIKQSCSLILLCLVVAPLIPILMTQCLHWVWIHDRRSNKQPYGTIWFCPLPSLGALSLPCGATFRKSRASRDHGK